MVRPSCPALVIHDDDAFRKNLIAALDQQNFTVTFASDGDGAVDLLAKRKFNVVLLGVNLAAKKGLTALEYLRGAKNDLACGILVLGDPDPQLRTLASWADETMLKPVDASYVATRARSYCDCD
jgi:two-component system, OmpR family, response regulator QseB